jgi:TRAP transporter 4TM/12TM fusion protein
MAYGLWGSNVPGQFQALYLSPERLAAQLALDSGGILGTPLAIAATVVVVFVAFGRLLEHLGGAGFFTDLATALMGGFRGGAAKISILASGLFGSISGSAVSNVATTGVVTIPLMRRAGFTRETSAGVEAVASTGGQLAPPVMGAAAFLMAEFLNVPYSEVVVAALVPALLYYLAIFVIADLTAAQQGIHGVPATDRPRPGVTLRAGWPFLLPFAALIWGLFALNLQPEAAGILAGLVLLICAPLSPLARGKMGPLTLLQGIAKGGGALSQIVIITAAAGVVIGVMNETGLGFGLTTYLVGFARDEVLALLALAAVVSIVLGMGMPTIAVYVLLATLIAPALTELGIPPMAAHLFVLYFGMMSMITPPVAIAAFAAASISGARPMGTALQAMKFGWPAYVLPFAFALNPALILQGGAIAAVLGILAAALGVLAISTALVGQARGRIGPVLRLGAAAAGAACLAWPLVV